MAKKIVLAKRLKRLSRLQTFAVVIVLILLSSAVVFWQTTKGQADNTNIAIPVDTCAAQNNLTFTCYRTQLTNIVKENGPQPAFALLKQQYKTSAYVKSRCHPLTHIIGLAAYTRYGSVGDSFTHGDQFCWAGYYHGLMEQLAVEEGTEKFLASLNNVCQPIADKSRYSFDHYNCVHGLGHGVMETFKGELFKSLQACDYLIDDYNRTSCYGGVYMQNIMIAQNPDEYADHTSKYLKSDDPMYPCTAVNEQYKQQCYLMQTSHALQVEGYDFTKVFGLCNLTAEPHRTTCYQSLGRDASGQSISDVARTKSSCMLGRDFAAQSNCIIGAAKDFVSYFHNDKQARELCSSLADTLSAICASTVTAYYATF
ncbi:hypothetical protein HY379_00150 [Candidatus Saccharibacteria bacterium]|nr:hypothetical protein [Candidatus Saccharibacteria bacterium]